MASMPSRPYDALYDTTYAVSGARDHYRQQGVQAGGVLIERVPDHANFFSELQHHPASTFRLKANERLPGFVDRAFHEHAPQPGTLRWQSASARVSGADQCRYLARPLLPAGTALEPPVRLAPPPEPAAAPEPHAPPPRAKDAATQSDFRESEAQTLPWSPDWVLPADPARRARQAALCAQLHCEGPELLQLADLTWGAGLPGGLAEVRRLEKLRDKRAFEASLPAASDAASLAARARLVQAREAAEWREREQELAHSHEEQLAAREAALRAREQSIEEAHRAQLEARAAAALAATAPKFAALQAERLKTARLLAAQRARMVAAGGGSGASSARGKAGSIVERYADYGSAVYAPLAREGRFPDAPKAATAAAAASASAAAGWQPPGGLAGLAQMEAGLPCGALAPAAPRPLPPPQDVQLSSRKRLAAGVRADVEAIGALLEAAKATHGGGRGVGAVWPCPLDAADLAATAAPQGRASRAGGTMRAGAGGSKPMLTDSKQQQNQHARSSAASPLPPPPADDGGRHAAVVLLQRLLRGRAAQNEMYAGKMAQLALIRELRLPEAASSGTGCQQRPEARGAATQELDAAIGAALCRVCCLLTSGDDDAAAQLLLHVTAAQQQQQQQEEAEELLLLQQQLEQEQQQLAGRELQQQQPPVLSPLEEQQQQQPAGGELQRHEAAGSFEAATQEAVQGALPEEQQPEQQRHSCQDALLQQPAPAAECSGAQAAGEPTAVQPADGPTAGAAHAEPVPAAGDAAATAAAEEGDAAASAAQPANGAEQADAIPDGGSQLLLGDAPPPPLQQQQLEAAGASSGEEPPPAAAAAGAQLEQQRGSGEAAVQAVAGDASAAEEGLSAVSVQQELAAADGAAAASQQAADAVNDGAAASAGADDDASREAAAADDAPQAAGDAEGAGGGGDASSEQL